MIKIYAYSTGQVNLAPGLTAQASGKAKAEAEINLDVKVKWTWTGPKVSIEKLEFALLGTAQINAQADGQFAASFAKTVPLPPGWQDKALTLWAGPIPIVFYTTVQPSLTLDASVNAAAQVKAGLDAWAKAGLTYSSGSWQPIKDYGATPYGELSASASGSLGARLNLDASVKLYGIAGPYAKAEIGSVLTASQDAVSGEGALDLTARAAATVGASIEIKKILGIPVNWQGPKWERTWAWESLLLHRDWDLIA